MRVLGVLCLCVLAGCGTSSQGDASGGVADGVGLSLGSPAVDMSGSADGRIQITFPAARGDRPLVTAVEAHGAGIVGLADLPDPSDSTYTIHDDGVVIYFPQADSTPFT